MYKSIILLFSLILFSGNLYSQIFLEAQDFSDKDFPLLILSEGFNSPAFPPSGWSATVITGSYNWYFSYNGAYCTSFGSAKFPFRDTPSGSIARLISPTYVPTSEGRDSLLFSQAYCQNPNVTDALEIYVSTNSGSSWQLLMTYTSPNLITAPSTSASFTPTCNQWQNKSIYLPLNTNRIFFQAAGGNGNNLYLDEVLVKPSGISGIPRYSTEVPVRYELFNNYPNPFNPSTKIRFDITERTNVKLVVYNSAGEEVTVLVNNVLGTGKYEVTFTALNLSSGIYFYRLITDNFSDTRKMILVK